MQGTGWVKTETFQDLPNVNYDSELQTVQNKSSLNESKEI